MITGDVPHLLGWASSVTLAAGVPSCRVTGMALLEDDREISSAPADSIAVLTRGAADAVRRYRLDILLAQARVRRVAVVILPTAERLSLPIEATDVPVCVITLAPDTNLGRVLLDLARGISADDQQAVLRAQAGLAVIRQVEAEHIQDPSAIADALRNVMSGIDFGIAPGKNVLRAVSAHPDDSGHAFSTPDNGEPLRTIDELLLRAASSARYRNWGVTNTPQLTLATLLAEILASRTMPAVELENRARLFGFSSAGWHLVAVVQLAERQPRHPEQEFSQIALEEMTRATALRNLRHNATPWHWTRLGSVLVLIATWPRRPGPQSQESTIAACRETYAALVELVGSSHCVAVGVSSLNQGVEGLRRAVAEARSAARPRRSIPDNTFRKFDEFGIDQALLDWYTSDEARESARRMLAPFGRLPVAKAETLIQTLQTYLDHQGSITATADALYVHRNTLKHRMARIRELLDCDLSDPETRLAIQLACRGRHLLDWGSRSAPSS